MWDNDTQTLRMSITLEYIGMILYQNSSLSDIGRGQICFDVVLPVRPLIVLNEKISYSNDHKLELAFRRFLRVLNESLYGEITENIMMASRRPLP